MGRHTIRRKYQTGGVIPSFQGVGALSRGPQVAPVQVRPIEYDPNPALNAQRARESALRTAISQAEVNQREKQQMWREEIYNRQYVDEKAKLLRDQLQASQDSLTKLDLNIPEQFKMAQEMRRSLEEINQAGVSVLTDKTLSPEDRAIRLQEHTAKAQSMFSNPNYQQYLQRNALASNVYNGILKEVSSGKLIDYEAVGSIFDATAQYQRGGLDNNQFFSSLKNFSVDPAVADKFETKVDGYIRDSLDPDKAASNWEKYKDDEDFLIFHKQFTVPDLDTQVETVYNLYMNDPYWWKVQKARGTDRNFLDDQGFVDENKFKNHIRRKIELFRTSLGAQGKTITTDINVNKRPADAEDKIGVADKFANQMEAELNELGYDVKLKSVLDGVGSSAEAKRILDTPDSQLDPDEKKLKRDLEAGLVKRPPAKPKAEPASVQGPGGIRATYDPEVGFNSLGKIYDDLRPGNNNDLIPEKLDKNLGFYTNNPFNIKTESKDTNLPHTNRFDTEASGGYHRVFPNMEEGIKAGASLLNNYMTDKGTGYPKNATFERNLRAQGKTLEDATVADMYKTWATGASDAKIRKIAEIAGVTPDTKLVDAPIEGLLEGMLSIENPEIFKALYSTEALGMKTEPIGGSAPVGTPSRASIMTRQIPPAVPQTAPSVEQGEVKDYSKYER